MTKGLRDLTAEEGRSAFGWDTANYASARPGYPDWVFQTLQQRCGLKPETATFEIGPGTGQATARLIALGAVPLVAIEPDARLAAFLRTRFGGAVQVANSTFEDVVLEESSFALGTAATSFHWLSQGPALAKVARLLRRGGWWASWWNVFGDPERDDPFHEATKELLQNLADSPSHHAGEAHPFALDRARRLAEINAAGVFDDVQVDIRKWTLVLSTAQTRALYATFSQFSILDAAERERILDGLARIAEEEFGGRVERNMCTALYIARRV